MGEPSAAQQSPRCRLVGELDRHDGQDIVRDLFVKPPKMLPLASSPSASKGSIVLARRESDGRAHVEQLLAPAGSALASMYRLAAKHLLNPAFPDAVEAEVQPGRVDPEHGPRGTGNGK